MNSKLVQFARRNSRPFCNCGPIALLLGLFLLSVVNLAQGSSHNVLAGVSAAATSDFVIADFDGDRKPDLATVQTSGNGLRESRYSICFQLSTGLRQKFGLTAPIGGLQLDSRDVNGDHLTDLIVSTTWFGRPVAILLNDGHGKFTLVDPNEFPSAQRPLQESWTSPTIQATDISAIPPPRPLTKYLLRQLPGFLAGNEQKRAARRSARIHVSKKVLTASDRAPPEFVLHV
jgi:hypothetical protein